MGNAYRFIWKWIKTNNVMLVNTISLVGTTAVTSGLGFVYWWVAVRWFSPAAVGLGSAEISAMTLLGTICMLGLGTLLVSEIPHHKGKELALLGAVLIPVGGVSWIAGMLFVLIAPDASSNFQPLRGSVMDVVLFACGVSLMAVALVFDEGILGLLRGELQLWRNSIFAMVKFIALLLAGLWLVQKTGMTIYATWAIGNLVSLSIILAYTFLKLKNANRSYRPQWGLLRKLQATAIRHHVLNLTLQVPSLTLPVLVTVLLSPTANAWFYVSWMLAGWGSLLPTTLSTVLFATNAARPELLVQKARITIGLAVAASLMVTGGLLLCTPQMLGVFGHLYIEQASWCLRVLALGAFPRIIKDHYVAICRIRGQVRSAILPMIAGCLLELTLAALGAHVAGLFGLSLGWLIALCVEAIFCFNKVYETIFCSNNITRSSNDLTGTDYAN